MIATSVERCGFVTCKCKVDVDERVFVDNQFEIINIRINRVSIRKKLILDFSECKCLCGLCMAGGIAVVVRTRWCWKF